MNGGECRELEDGLAKTLMALDLVEENKVTHKKIKVKKDGPINEGSSKRS